LLLLLLLLLLCLTLNGTQANHQHNLSSKKIESWICDLLPKKLLTETMNFRNIFFASLWNFLSDCN